MARHLFIAQQTLSTWMDQDKISFDGHVMTILADGRQFSLVEAVRFIKVEGGDEDSAGLIGKVKTNEQLVAMGAERYRDSVIFGELAFGVQEGFIGEVFLKKEQEEEPAQRAPQQGEVAESPPADPPQAAPLAEKAIEAAPDRTADPAAGQPFTLLPKSSIKTAPQPEAEAASGEPLTLRPKVAMDVARTQPSLPAVSEKAEARATEAPPASSASDSAPSVGPGAASTAAHQPPAQPDGSKKDAKPAAPGGSAAKQDDDLSDEELLTRFLLENL